MYVAYPLCFVKLNSAIWMDFNRHMPKPEEPRLPLPREVADEFRSYKTLGTLWALWDRTLHRHTSEVHTDDNDPIESENPDPWNRIFLCNAVMMDWQLLDLMLVVIREYHSDCFCQSLGRTSCGMVIPLVINNPRHHLYLADRRATLVLSHSDPPFSDQLSVFELQSMASHCQLYQAPWPDREGTE